jgi:hypothetical protein
MTYEINRTQEEISAITDKFEKGIKDLCKELDIFCGTFLPFVTLSHEEWKDMTESYDKRLFGFMFNRGYIDVDKISEELAKDQEIIHHG